MDKILHSYNYENVLSSSVLNSVDDSRIIFQRNAAKDILIYQQGGNIQIDQEWRLLATLKATHQVDGEQLYSFIEEESTASFLSEQDFDILDHIEELQK